MADTLKETKNPKDMADRPLREQSLVYSLRDGMAWSVMVGFGDQYVGAFAIFLAATSLQMGVLASLPPFIASLSQIFAAQLTDRVQNRRAVFVPSAGIQACVWLLIFWIPTSLDPQFAIPALIVFVTLLHMGGQFTVPAWSSLMADLVPADSRGSYFGRRNRICHFFTISSVALAGGVLHLFKSRGHDMHVNGFLVIFTVAWIARLVSTRYLFLQYEPPYVAPPREDRFGFLDYLRSLPGTNFGRFALFMCLINFAVHLSAPFFVVYVLRDLGFTYLQFTVGNVTAVFAQILTLVFWGKAADRFGNRWVLLACAAVISCAPFLLPFSTNFWYVVAFLFVTSSAGAGFNLAAANYAFEAVAPDRLARFIAYFHVTTASGVLLGGLTGGWLAEHVVTATPGLGPFHLTLASSLLMLFMISGVLRILVLLTFRSGFQELRQVEPAPPARRLFRMIFLERDLSRWRFPFK